MMADAESPSTVFEMHYTRLSEATSEKPCHVAYDNSCNLHAYWMNREPEFFMHTCDKVDALHKKGHTKCSINKCTSTARATLIFCDFPDSHATHDNDLGAAPACM